MEFTERKVLILVKSRPYGEIINFEGWRAAVGMFGMDHPDISDSTHIFSIIFAVEWNR